VPTSSIPSECLLGLSLNDGWEVVEQIHKSPHATGGHFSSGYRIKKGSQEAYLKALDFSSALGSTDVLRELQALLEAYNFERDLLYKCRDRNLSKVVVPINDGSVEVPGFPPPFVNRVYYIVFTLADGDIRKVKDAFTDVNVAFAFRSLHNVAVGLEQLHRVEIAHQDLKPSNVLVFQKEARIGDLGRASDRSHPFRNDSLREPGDRNYSPVEQWYGYHFSNDFSERYAADLYLLGSLFVFFFCGMSMSQCMHTQLAAVNARLTSDFRTDMVELENAFASVLLDFRAWVARYIKSDLQLERAVKLLEWLCSPDPERRGHPKNLLIPASRFSLERFITQLEILAKRAELNLL
jgi:eukaryotic-like serine/threonine-protein kinase